MSSLRPVNREGRLTVKLDQKSENLHELRSTLKNYLYVDCDQCISLQGVANKSDEITALTAVRRPTVLVLVFSVDKVRC